MTAVYTEPPAVTLNQVAVPSDWNIYVRDNNIYFYENMARKPVIVSATMETERTKTGDTNWAAVSGASIQVTITETSDVTIVANFNTKNSGAYSHEHRILRDGTTQVGIDERQVGGSDYQHGQVIAHDQARPPGTYTYALYHKTGNASGTVYTDQVTMYARAEVVA